MEIKIFQNADLGNIRTLLEPNGRVLFCGIDVAQALGYQNSRAALTRHCKGVTKRDTLTDGGLQTLLFIPEPDVYRLIMRSKQPSAERFEAWVVETVLPSIRRTGAYLMPTTLQEVTSDPEAAAKLFFELQQWQDKVNALQPKAYYYDALVDNKLLTGIRQTAKELKLPERLFTFLLQDMGFAYRTPKRKLMPYAFMVNMGYVELKEYTTGKHGGVYILFTPKGRLYLLKRIEQRLAKKPKENEWEREPKCLTEK